MTVIEVEGAAFPGYNEAAPFKAPRNRRQPDNLGTITLASVQGRGIDGNGQLEAPAPRDSQPGPVTDSVCLDGCRAAVQIAGSGCLRHPPSARSVSPRTATWASGQVTAARWSGRAQRRSSRPLELAADHRFTISR